jgi:endonuclease/exonuclease/phosphatase family metal-dependent hydrolase
MAGMKWTGQNWPTRRWLPRAALLAGSVSLWALARFCLPPPALHGSLLALTFLGGVALLLRGAVGLRSRLGKGLLADTVLGLGAAVSALAFLFAVLSNREEELPVTRVAPDTGNPPARIRLVDFNALHGIPGFEGQEARFQDTLAAFRALRPDVIVLQEAWDTARHGNLARRLGEGLRLNHVYARANGSRRWLGYEEGSAVLSRFPILDARRLRLSPRRPWWECRIAMVATLEVGGRPLTVAGLHCHDRDEEVAADQAGGLLARLDRERPVVVAGDFNAGSGSAAVGQFVRAGYVEALPGGIDHLLLPGRPWGWRLEAAAWALRPEDLEPLLGKRVEVSDHPATLADLVPEP